MLAEHAVRATLSVLKSHALLGWEAAVEAGAWFCTYNKKKTAFTMISVLSDCCLWKLINGFFSVAMSITDKLLKKV